MIKALIFDFDGTIAETEETHRRAFNETFQAAGLDWNWDRAEYGRLLKVAGGKERMRHYRALRGDGGPSDTGIAAIHCSKTERYNQIVAQGGLSLRPGVAELASRVRADGIRLAVATTTSRVNVDVLCRASWGAEAEDIFEVIASGDEVLNKKPDPAVYLLALARLGLTPSEAIALEDSAIGLTAARAAGLACVVTPSAYTRSEDFARASWKVDRLDDWLGEWAELIETQSGCGRV